MNWLQIFRLVALGFSVFCGLIVMSLGAHLTALSNKDLDGFVDFEPFAVAVGVITLVTVSPMLVIDFLRTGAFTSMVLVELVWLSILWVLWLAEGALTADETGKVFSQTCDFDAFSTVLTQACNETRAIEAFAFLAWIVLLAYTGTLLVVAFLNHSRGAPMWTSSVKQHHGLASAAQQQPSVLPQTQGQGQYYPPQQQQQPIQMQMYGASPAPTSPPPMPTPAMGPGAYSTGGSVSAANHGHPQL